MIEWGLLIHWSLSIGYTVLLCALTCLNRERGPMRRTIWTLFVVMLASYAYQILVGGAWHYSAFMIIVNAIACRVITKEPAGQWQGLIGWSFIIQIGADAGRVGRELSSGPGDMTFLYWVTTALAFAQLLTVIRWGVHDRVVRERGGRNNHSLADQARYAGAP
jgi:hypothetical protein